MNEIENILSQLSPEEQKAVLKILAEESLTGKSKSLNEVYDADYEEIPVDIDTFLESPEYLGGSTDNGKAIYPYWRDAYRKIIDEDKIEIALGGSIGSGKALLLDANLVGPNGYFKMRDVKVGDLVAGQDGKFYHVTSVWPQDKMPIYRITFSDHTHIDCSIDHLWNIRRTDRASKKQPYPNASYVYETKSVRWLLQQELKIGKGRVDKNGHKLEQNRFAIQCTLPVEFNNDYDMVIPPYLMGVLLADGALTGNSVGISIYEEDIKQRVIELIEPLGYELHLSNESEKYPGLGDFNIVSVIKGRNGILDELRKLNLCVKSIDKHIPNEYLLSSVENRLELLRGLVDGDGYICPAVYMYSTSSKKLYEDFCFLVYSLGGTVNLTEGKDAYRYLPDGSKIKSDHLNYEFTFHMPKAIRAFHSKKHKKRFGKGTQYHEMEYRFIESIEYLRDDYCQCITVDNPESLYLTDNFTVTHNTTAAIYLMIYFVYKLMCLRNIRQYYQLEGNGPVCVAFLNNTLQLSKGVAYDKFMSTVANSPWFLARGEVRGTVNIRYKPKKNIEFVIGSSSDQIIGRDIFCLTGDTEILTADGYRRLDQLEGNNAYVYTYLDEQTKLSESKCQIVLSKYTKRLIELELEDGTIIRCTPEHKFLTTSGDYKEAQYLTAEDDLLEPPITNSWQNIALWATLHHVDSPEYLTHYINFIKSRQYNSFSKLDYTEHHHIVPRCIANYSLTVKLSPEDHFTAHYLLAKALGGDLWYAVHLMASAAPRNPKLRGHRIDNISKKQFAELRYNCAEQNKCRDLTNFQSAAREYNESIRGHRVINNGQQDKRVPPEELDTWLDTGWHLGSVCRGIPKIWSHEARARLAERNAIKQKRREEERLKRRADAAAHKSKIFSGSGNPNYGKIGANAGKISIYRENVCIYIHPEDLNSYLSKGWVRGRLPQSQKNAAKGNLKYEYEVHGKLFCSIKQVADYLNSIGYQGISDSSVQRIVNGLPVSKWQHLSHLIIRRPISHES